jgi:hypothetical protein
MSKISDLKDQYAGMPGYVVGKGPSLEHLRLSHFEMELSPVIVLNDAILKVQTLELPNDIYSLQKDGCGHRLISEQCKPDCGERPHMVYPSDPDITIIQQRVYSPYCLPRWKNKIWIEAVAELGINEPAEMAVIMAIEIARLMGCDKIIMVACDSLVNSNELRTYDPRSGESQVTTAGKFYAFARKRILRRLEKTEYQIIIPEADNGN